MIIRDTNLSNTINIAKMYIDVWRISYSGTMPDEYFITLIRRCLKYA